jgi:uncharacterized protein
MFTPGFEWDTNKDRANKRNHGVAFSEAATVFADPLSLTIYDEEHSVSEERELTIGLSIYARLLVVSHTQRGDNIRIISAREAENDERRDYEEGSGQFE